MKDSVVTIEKDYFFKQHNHVHIHLSDECKDYIAVLHKHKFIEVVYILSGKAKHIMEQKEYFVKKGDVCVINSYETHAFMPDEACGEKFLAYDLMFTPDFMDKACFEGDDFSQLSDSFLFYSLFPDDKDFKERFNLIPNCRCELESAFEKIYTEYKNQKTGYINLIRLYSAEILIQLFRKIQYVDQNTLSASQKRIVMDIIEYIEQNYNIKIKTEEIASKMFFNKNYISRLFKKETGLSVHEFVKNIRIQEACKLLSSTKSTIADIATDCGFSDTKSFYTAFKKSTGYTPNMYRNKSGIRESTP